MKPQQPFRVLYQDDCIIAVNKAAGIAVSADRWDDTKERLDKLLTTVFDRVFMVHRIDRDTSGLVVFALDKETHKQLSRAFEEHQVQKRYIAVVHGRPSWKETRCELPLVPDGDKQHRTIIDKYRGKQSGTRFRVLGNAGNYSVIEALPETGRTHQIRVHLSSLGHPVVCDPLYGTVKPVLLSSFKRGWRGDPLEERPLLSRLGLHAAELVLPEYHGKTGENLVLNAPLPRDLGALINQMEKMEKNVTIPG